MSAGFQNLAKEAFSPVLHTTLDLTSFSHDGREAEEIHLLAAQVWDWKEHHSLTCNRKTITATT